MPENEPVVITVGDTAITYFEKLKHIRLFGLQEQVGNILHLATQQPEQPPSGVHLGQLFINSGVTTDQAKALKGYFSSGASRLRDPKQEKQTYQALEILSGAIAFMNTKNLPKRENPPVDSAISGRHGALHLPDVSRKQSE